ncbi:SRPBCC domain-containing protein [Nesterenkonia ebinurensis]|uniref:SRPBCC domain-containing protein n=1 Tax=Nesterenkonia ebinurensis TaxID=2608252 RepID=UPI0021E0B6FE|nr:SRPBCC domain-containing protein [Nesterenkonia ebinurensis]
MTVVDAEPPHRLSFRWVYEDAVATPANSLLVTFELVPSGVGTLLRFTETGFREKGWEIATLEAKYADHSRGWDTFLGNIVDYATRLASTP